MAARSKNPASKRRVNPVGAVAVPLEKDQQAALFEWMAYICVPLEGVPSWLPLSDIAFAVPNGTSIAGTPKQRAMYMASLKKQGFKPGVSDIVIPYPVLANHGLFIELKRDKTSPVSDAQWEWRDLMRRLNYKAEVCVGFDAARSTIQSYLDGIYRTVSQPSSGGMVI